MRFIYYWIALILTFGGLGAVKTVVDFGLDKSRWDIAYEGEVDNFKIIEYVPKGQSIENWSELISVVAYDGVSVSPGSVFKSMIEEIKYRDPDSTVESSILENGEDSLIAVWNLKNSKTPEERNWIKIFAKNNELHTLLVTSKQCKEAEPKSKVWEKMLKNAKLVSK